MEGEHVHIETKHYSDGSSATGPAPLPDLSPEQQEARRVLHVEETARDLVEALGADLDLAGISGGLSQRTLDAHVAALDALAVPALRL